ncbi:MAG: hypothetical protein IH595_09585 [Bacteroidales bacterium]|nr:hypothetical protein [Bacteroidales bacterium]
MKLSKGYRIAIKVIAFIFFALALVGFTHMLNGKFPTFHFPDHEKTAYEAGLEAGTYLGVYFKFYILPFVFAYAGWRLYKVGGVKPELTIPEEDESKKISE